MKKTLVGLIHFYQRFLSLPLRTVTGVASSCRFFPSCSEYAAISIEKFGVARGGSMAIGRLLSCQPFSLQKWDQGKLLESI